MTGHEDFVCFRFSCLYGEDDCNNQNWRQLELLPSWNVE